MVTIVHEQYNMVFGSLLIGSQYFVLCLSGTNILRKSEDIGKTLYMSKWYNLKDIEKQAILNIIQMSQKPCTLSAGGFGYVLLSRFNSV